ncbi:hypothetical protein PIB30_042020 [Stylosanthes scabra]|uniref:Uncharacterized protein n=1 Tax=Stylosanthes scabra TaxID=79078 RepID=A0ABU6TFR4_9FABA|nr:hypothetical protein [Stylosanthes scabra]
MFAIFFRRRVSNHNRRFPRTGTRISHPFVLVNVREPIPEFFLQLLITFFSLLQQSLLPRGHGFRPFHRLGGDLRLASLSLEEFSQGSFHLLDVLVPGDYSLFRGKLGDAFISTLVVELSVHHLSLEVQFSSILKSSPHRRRQC